MKNIERKGLLEIAERIIDAINDGYLEGRDVSDLHHEVFNTDYFIIGYYESEKWLNENIGVFNAIERIREYEMLNFGEVLTDFGSSENVCNMYTYIIGEELIYSLDAVQECDGELTIEVLESIKEEVENV